MTDPRPVVALLIILFIIFSPDPQAPITRAAKSRLDDTLAIETYALDALNRSRLGDFNPREDRWLNISGCTNEIDFAWQSLDAVKRRAVEVEGHAMAREPGAMIIGHADLDLPFFENVTGVLRGSWTRSKFDPPLGVSPLNLSKHAPETPWGPAPITEFGRNLSESSGSLKVRLGERDYEDSVDIENDDRRGRVQTTRLITAEIEVENGDGQSMTWAARAHGVHFVETGSIVMSTTSEKFFGLAILPHLTLFNSDFSKAQRLINRTVQATIEKQRDGTIEMSNPWTSAADGVTDSAFVATNCELILWLQQHPRTLSNAETDAQQRSLLHEIEREMRFPTGAVLPSAPEMRFSLTAFSPDCGYAFESKGPPNFAVGEFNHLSGAKVEVEYSHGRRHLLLYIAVLSAQLWLLKTQMKDASTPSTRSRISFYTISILSMGDGFTTMTFALISLFTPNIWILLMTTCFMSFMSVSFFSMRFLMDIWAVQASERDRRDRERRPQADMQTSTTPASVPSGVPTQTQSPTQVQVQPTESRPPPRNTNVPPDQQPATTTNTRPADTATLPLPVTAQRLTDTGAVPIFIPSDQDDPIGAADPTNLGAIAQNQPSGASSFRSLYIRFYLLLLLVLFLSLNAATWPSRYRRIYFTSLAFLYLSFWVPQIVRNIVRNCRRALRWDFVIGQSLLRLSPFAYFYGYSTNVLFAEVDLTDLAILACWLWIQCVVLASQEIIGPRWFVRDKWVPPAYDYHPLLREDEEGGNLPIGFSQATASSPLESPTLTSKPGESRDRGMKMFDCAICMQDLEVPVATSNESVPSGLTGAAGLLARRAYMVTPCRHIFHSPCLEGWMKYRLQCPICREPLPPL